jgi:adenosine deaminase
MSQLDEFIEAMPKCELHMHLEGSLEPEMKFALAARNGIVLPYSGVAEMRAAYTFTDLTSFLKIYYEGMGVLVTEKDFFDLTYAYLTKARSQNVLYSEMFFDPQPHRGRGVAFATIVGGIHRAQVEAERALGIKSQLIMCFLRDMSAESAMTTLIESLQHKSWIVGVGLDSDERGNPPSKFREVFARARKEGYRLTMHCDVDQDNSVEHIRQVIEDIGVDRIDHGVNSLENDRLCQEIVKRKLALTVCPVSNACVTDNSKSKEIKRMLGKDMRATVNSDDPAYFQAYMTENLARAQSDADLGKQELVQLVRNAFEATWLPQSTKDSYLASLDGFAAARSAA